MIRRLFFCLFGLLDAILVVRFATCEIAQLASAVHEPIQGALPDVLRAAFFVSLIASAVGLYLMKKWALTISYVQFPFRFVFMLLSFGFISGAAHLLSIPGLYRPLIYAAMVLECGRLVGSVWLHLTPAKSVHLQPPRLPVDRL
jgi:hypothetical protein